MADSRLPLQGVRVLDASRVLAGPFCGQVLGDLGAEVIKVERPGQGDDTRAWGPPWLGSLSAYFLSCNRNKKGITLDLARPEGIEVFHGLVARSDILLENFRADSAAKLGLDPARLHAINPRLIVCSISGFGRTGPLRDRPGYDFAVQALSGLMSITGPVEGPPCKVGVAVTDVLTGLYAAVGVLACLHARQHTGHGYALDLALLDCAVASQVNVPQVYLTSGSVPERQGNAHLQIVPYQLCATADGWLVLAVGNDRQWQHFCEAAGQPELSADPRFVTNPLRVQNRAILVPLVEALMRTHSTA
ncbi:MAG TPA: CoA transferase, partial [Gemmataceae bacterium]|nr:CoA transferase [Gemmataceae bacterium]